MTPLAMVEMPLRRRNRTNLRPVHSIKHVVDLQFATVAGTQVNSILINTIDAPILSNVSSVETGSTVNAIFLKVECNQTSTTGGGLPNAYMIIVKNVGGNLMSIPANAVGSDDNKRFVIHQEMVMRQNLDNGNPRILFQGVIMIPRGYRRFGINDLLQIGILNPAGTMDVCVQCIYKEFR